MAFVHKVLEKKLKEMETQTDRESAGGEDTEWAELQFLRRNLCEILKEESGEADEVGLSKEETAQAVQSEEAGLIEEAGLSEEEKEESREEKRTPLFLLTKKIVHKHLERMDKQLSPSSAFDHEEHNHIIREAELIIERERLREELKEVKTRLKEGRKREKDQQRQREMEREIEREEAWEREKALEAVCLRRQRKVMMEMVERECHWKVEKERLKKIEKEQKKWMKQIKKRQRKIEKEIEASKLCKEERRSSVKNCPGLDGQGGSCVSELL